MTAAPMQARIWVRDGQPQLTIIANAPEGVGFDWPEQNGPLLVFDAGTEVVVTEVR